MCGIYMTAQTKNIHSGEKVFKGLKRIEYRGYDSWGVVVLTKNGFKLKKRTGKLSGVTSMKFADGLFALGHTRWATHGGVTQVNAHPHLAQNKVFALAHNGVVENYQDLREELLDWGYDFNSETDTEIIVGLIEKEMFNSFQLGANKDVGISKFKVDVKKTTAQTDSNKLNSAQLNSKIIRKVFAKLAGRNTIAVLTKEGHMFAVRDGSPLVVGRNRGASFVSTTFFNKKDRVRNKELGNVFFSSDVISMSGEVDEYMIIKSGQMVEYKDKKISVIETKSGKKVELKFTPMSLDKTVIDKEGFSSFMLKEIHEQARVLNNVVSGKEKKFKNAAKAIKKAKNIFTLGAGTASYAAFHTAYLFRKIGLNATSIASYEADSYKNLCNEKSVCIVYSQSGETADTNEVVEWMKAKGVQIISAVNMQGSTLTQLSDIPFMLDVGPELAVASTKAFFAQMVWGMTMTSVLSERRFDDIKEDILEFEQVLRKWLSTKSIQEKIRKLAVGLSRKKHLFVLGRGDLYSSSLESALKLKEISYIHAEGFSGGELKHGVIALIEKGTPVLCLVAEDENKANMMNAIAEVNARGGYTIVISSEDNELYKEWIEVPEFKMGGVNMMTLMSIVPSQLLTCYMAMEKNYDVDKPRNLAKSVTVK